MARFIDKHLDTWLKKNYICNNNIKNNKNENNNTNNINKNIKNKNTIKKWFHILCAQNQVSPAVTLG